MVVTLSVGGMLEVVAGRHDPEGPSTALWFSLPAVGLLGLVLLARRRFPFGGPVAYWAGGSALSFADSRLVGFPTSIFILGMTASFLLGTPRDDGRAGVGLAVVLGGAITVVGRIPGRSVGTLLFIPLLFAICWLAGFALRDRADRAEAAEVRAHRAEQDLDAAARLAVAEERARIARELHDIVAHAVSVMVLQVGAVRHQLPDELMDNREALRNVEQAGRIALADMRRLLAAMRSDEDDIELTPQPGLDRLNSLVEEIGRAGLPVRVHVHGEPFPLPPGVDLSAYRIVQEGLTNALKHAAAQSADVTLWYRPDKLELEVRDDGKGSSISDGAGHGLVGIRERVKIFGGEMTAAGGVPGGFVLSTSLPLADGRP